ncbi:MAG: YdcF family protein [Oscillospiraceae bacterium]|nr:YdcF family protein [Oscillospiraceae bacterium]
MLRFDTRDKKPKVWSIAVLFAVTVIITVFLVTRENMSFRAVSVVTFLFLASCVFLLVQAFVRQLRYNPYSYNTIYYIGFALFIFAVMILQVMLMVSVWKYSISDRVGISNILSTVVSSAGTYMLFSAPVILIFSIALCLSNIALIRHEGRRLVNLLGILLSVLMVGGVVLWFTANQYVSGSVWEVMLHDLLSNLYASVYLYFECMLIGTVIANVIVVKYEPEKNKDFLVILGCGIRKNGTPTPILAGRIERALRFYREQIAETGKAPIFITSGGQGPDEVISESESMKNYLMEKGVPEEHIIEENRSTSTYENMMYSKEIIKNFNPDGKVVFSTSNYHIFRSGLMARRQKIRAVGIGAKTKWYFWPNASVREFVGLLTEHRLKQALILGGMILFYTVLTVLNYIL